MLPCRGTVLALVSIALLGCATESDVPAIVTDLKIDEGQHQAYASASTIWRGIYISGAEVSEFTPCDSPGLHYWLGVAHKDAGFDSLKAWVHEIRLAEGESYPAMYIEFDGEFVGKATDGFAADYDGVIQLHRLIGFNKDLPAQCLPGTN